MKKEKQNKKTAVLSLHVAALFLQISQYHTVIMNVFLIGIKRDPLTASEEC